MGYGISLFTIELVPKQLDLQGNVVPFQAQMAYIGKKTHEILAYFFTGLILLHMFAALKHHFWDKDDTLNRMLGRNSQLNKVN